MKLRLLGSFLIGSGITLIIDKIWWLNFSHYNVPVDHFFLGTMSVVLGLILVMKR